MTDVLEQDVQSTNPHCWLTFQQWASERLWHDMYVPSEITGMLDEDVGPGFSYPGGLYIERITDAWSEKIRKEGEYYLLIERDEYVGSLADLEKRLYLFGATYGYLDHIKPTPPTVN